MRGQIQDIIIFLSAILIVTVVSGMYISNVLNPSTAQASSITRETAKAIFPSAEVVSYYMNETNIVFYVKVYRDINLSKVVFYINGRPAKFYPNRGIIKKGKTVTVIGNISDKYYEYDLLGVLEGKYYIVKYTAPVITSVRKICPWYFAQWLCRVPISVSYSGLPIKDFQLNITFDSSKYINNGDLKSDCGDIRFTALYPYEGTDYKEGLVLDIHFDKDIKDYSGLDNDGTLISGSYIKFLYNYGLEDPTAAFPGLNLTKFVIEFWATFKNNTLPSDWWDENWKYKIPINVTNNNNFEIYGYPVKLNINTEILYSSGKVKNDLSDIRIVEDVPIFNLTIFNPNTYSLYDYQLSLSIQDIVQKATKAVNGTEVFDLYDDFNDGVIDDYWNITGESYGVARIENGLLYLEDTSTSGSIAISRDIIINYPAIAEARFMPLTTTYLYPLYGSTVDTSGSLATYYWFVTYSRYIEYYYSLAGYRPYTQEGTSSYITYSTNTWYIIGWYWDRNNNQVFVKLNDTKSNPIPSYNSLSNYVDYIFKLTVLSGARSYSGGKYYLDWIRVRKFANQDPVVTIYPENKTIEIYNPNTYNLYNFQVHIDQAELSKEKDIVLDVEYNGKTIPFCYEHSNGECDNITKDINGLWLKVNITAGSSIYLRYYTFYTNFSIYNPLTKRYLSYCFEQDNGECNQTKSEKIWVKIDYIPSNSYVDLWIIPEDVNNATDGSDVFLIYENWKGCSSVISCGWYCRVDDEDSSFSNPTNCNAEYVATLDTSDGTPSPSLYIYGEDDASDSGDNRHFIYKIIKKEPEVGLQVEINYKGYHGYYTADYKASVYIYDNGTKNYVAGHVFPGSNSVWYYNQSYKFLSELKGYDSLIVGFGLVDAWDANWNQYTKVDNIRVRKIADLELNLESVKMGRALLEIPFIFETSSGFSNTDTPSVDTWIWTKLKYLPANQNTTIYIYFGNPSASAKSYSPEDIFGENFMEIGKITLPAQSSSGQWFAFTFANTFTKVPVVIAEPDVTFNGNQPLTIWLRHITKTGFQARQKESSNLDDTHTSEDVFYIAIPPGSWETTGGVRVEAGRFNTTNWDVGDASTPSGAFTKIYYTFSFSNSPAVITQIQEIDNTLTGGWEAHTRIQNIQTTSFETAPEPQGDVTTQPNINVEIGWVAIEAHTSKDLAKYVKSEAGISSVSYDETWRTLSFYDTYSSPGFIGWIATNYGRDSSRLRGDSLSSNSISLSIQEDTSADSETRHTYESVSYFTFDYPGSPTKIYLRKYIPGITISYGSEESLEGYSVVEKKGSYGIKITNSNLYAYILTSAGLYSITTSINLDTVYFVALIYDGSTLKLYLNNTLVNSTTASGYPMMNSKPITMSFLGKIDELRIYNETLDLSRISKEFEGTLEKEIPYYIEKGTCNSQKTIVYVKLPVLVSQRIYMYLCNPSADSESDGSKVFDFYDDFEEFNGWIQYGSGRVSQDCSTFDFCALKKDTASWPNGGYKDLGFTIAYPFILESRFYRYDYAGGTWETLAGITDSSGYGYWLEGSAIEGNNKLRISRMDGYPSNTDLASVSGNYHAYQWYISRFIWYNGNLIGQVWSDGFETKVSEVSVYDNNYKSFSRIWVTNGYTYFVDWIRIRKFTDPWPQYTLGEKEEC